MRMYELPPITWKRDIKQHYKMSPSTFTAPSDTEAPVVEYPQVWKPTKEHPFQGI